MRITYLKWVATGADGYPDAIRRLTTSLKNRPGLGARLILRETAPTIETDYEPTDPREPLVRRLYEAQQFATAGTHLFEG